MFPLLTQRGRHFLILFSRNRQPGFVVEQAVPKPQGPSEKQHPIEKLQFLPFTCPKFLVPRTGSLEKHSMDGTPF